MKQPRRRTQDMSVESEMDNINKFNQLFEIGGVYIINEIG